MSRERRERRERLSWHCHYGHVVVHECCCPVTMEVPVPVSTAHSCAWALPRESRPAHLASSQPDRRAVCVCVWGGGVGGGGQSAGVDGRRIRLQLLGANRTDTNTNSNQAPWLLELLLTRSQRRLVRMRC
jgi:hypothetical protein